MKKQKSKTAMQRESEEKLQTAIDGMLKRWDEYQEKPMVELSEYEERVKQRVVIRIIDEALAGVYYTVTGFRDTWAPANKKKLHEATWKALQRLDEEGAFEEGTNEGILVLRTRYKEEAKEYAGSV